MFRRTALFALLLSPAVGFRAFADDPPADQRPSAEQAAALVEKMKDKEAGVRAQAATEAKGLQDEVLLAPLMRLLKDEYRTVREPAIRALGSREAQEARKKAATALAQRLHPAASNADLRVELLLLLEVLHDLAEPSTMTALLSDIAPDTDADVVRARLHAVANVPTKEAVEELIQFAAKGENAGSGGQREMALKALEYATGVRLGNLDAWHMWWTENRKAYDPAVAAERRAKAREEAEAKREKKAEKEKKKDGDGKPEGSGD